MAKENPSNLKYTSSHEWLKIEGEIGICGITDYAQKMLTDVVYIESPVINRNYNKGERITIVESVKSVTDIYAPVSGIVIDFNPRLSSEPELLNKDPFGEGWIFKIKINSFEEVSELLDASAYEKLIQGI